MIEKPGIEIHVIALDGSHVHTEEQWNSEIVWHWRLRIFVWNRVIPTWLRLRLEGTRLGCWFCDLFGEEAGADA
jgi:hypothetical protein